MKPLLMRFEVIGVTPGFLFMFPVLPAPADRQGIARYTATRGDVRQQLKVINQKRREKHNKTLRQVYSLRVKAPGL